MRYLIGVDAGGTKTIAVVYNLEGFRLAAFSTGPGNLTAGGDAARENLVAAVAGALAAVPGTCEFIGVGMAGFDPLVTPEAVRTLLEDRFGVPTLAVDDGQLALCAAHGLGDGIIVIAGTGSIAYGRRDGQLARRGGWGHLLGDRGSGWAIAADGVRQALQDDDDGLPQSDLTKALLATAGLDRLRPLLEMTYRQPKGDLAALAATVAAQAGAGDPVARGILMTAGRDLAALAVGLAGRLGLAAPAVACSGSILEHNEFVRAAFRQALLAGYPQATIHDEPLEPTRGAFALRNRKR